MYHLYRTQCGPTKARGGPGSRYEPFDGLDRLERLVHVADGRQVAEVHHGLLSLRVRVLQTQEVPHGVLGDRVMRGAVETRGEPRPRPLLRVHALRGGKRHPGISNQAITSELGGHLHERYSDQFSWRLNVASFNDTIDTQATFTLQQNWPGSSKIIAK